MQTNTTIKKQAVMYFFLGILCLPGLVMAQAPPPALAPAQLDVLVQRVALYPDPLLAQLFAAATYTDQIPEAAQWANQHSFLKGDPLAKAIADDHLPWDPSVQALLPFPQVLNMMNSDMGWTAQVGNAFMTQPNDVMDAVQRMRKAAYDYGYLQTNGQIQVVNSGGYIEILPVNPAFFYVPIYNPAVIFVRPRPGIGIRAAITFGPGITIGAAFAPWGWGPGLYAHFGWGAHTVFVNNHPWTRTWVNRREYVHPYEHVQRYQPQHRVESHHFEEHRGRER